jgi:hypothetical protein
MIIRKLGLVAALLISTQAHAEDCAKVEVLDNDCQIKSVKVDLTACGDNLISVSKPTCSGDLMKLKVRGANADYRIDLRGQNTGAWGASSWAISRFRTNARTTGGKDLPKTRTERTPVQAATLEVEKKDGATGETKVVSAFQFSAYLDLYYAHNFNNTRANTTRDPQNNLRYYDWYSNQLGLNLIEFTIKHVRKETAFLLDLDFGQFADINASAPTLQGSGGPTFSTADEISKHIGQAVFTYTPTAAPGFIFEAGKMPTHVGLELMKSKDNWNYSRSALFGYGGPFWHTGVHAGYSPIQNVLSVNAYVYNGWNTIYETNSAPTYGAQVKWVLNDRTTWVYNYIGGPEQPGNTVNWKQVHESNLSWTLTPTLAFATSFLYGEEDGVRADGGKANWYGTQAGFKWQTTPLFYVSPRIEFLRDSNGYALGSLVPQTLWTYTATTSFLLSEGFEFRFEGRLDHSSEKSRFVRGNGTTTNLQPTVLAAIIATM